MFRVIIAGGRDYNNYAELERKMDKLLSNIKDEIVIVMRYGKRRRYAWRAVRRIRKCP